MRTSRPIVFAIALLSHIALMGLVVAEETEIRIEEEDFKLAAEALAANDICADTKLRNMAGLDSASCEDDLTFYTRVCWPQFDGLGLSFEATNDDESRERLISVSLLYGSCVRSELLRKIVRKQESERRENDED